MSQIEGSRYYDRLLALGTASAQVFDIQNISDYFWLHSPKDFSEWTIRDFPKLSPPYQSFFTEFKRMPAYNAPRAPYAMGLLHESYDREKGDLPKGADKAYPSARWFMTSTLFGQQSKNKKSLTLARFLLGINDDGTACKNIIKDNYFVGDLYYKCFKADVGYSQEEREIFSSYGHIALYPALLAISFLHCKGVTIIQEQPNPKLSKNFSKKHNIPLVKFHRLSIEPMKEVLKRQGNVDEVGLKRALHIVRGHFADYSESGLFGRHHGLFWREQHIRGNKDNGLVLKDYDLKTPKDDFGQVILP
jgi:hypothetical protein